MGCCISSSQNSHNPQPNSHHFQASDIPHLTILEEETIVKEVVLSETPKITKPILPAGSPPLMKSPIPSSPESSIDPKRIINEQEISDIELSLSGVSDFLSFSAIDGVLSTSTVKTATMRRGKEEVVGPPVHGRRKKSFSGDVTGALGRLGKMSSPEKKSSFAPARGNGGSPPKRGVTAEVGRRRLGSPGNRGFGDGDRCMLEKGVPLKTRAPGCRSTDANAVKSRRVIEEAKDAVWGAAVESLENPLVSLECFIFL